MRGNRIGIIGGGQLGRMLTEAAKPLGFDVTVIDPVPNCPAEQVGATQIKASLLDSEAIEDLSIMTDVVTWEIEHINSEALKDLPNVEPSPYTLEIIKDKLQQKTHLKQNGIPVADFMAVDNEQDLKKALDKFGDLMLKTRFGGYDGRGNLSLRKPKWHHVEEMSGDSNKVYAEKIVPFAKELAIVIARDTRGRVEAYPVVETVHNNNICHLVLSPASIPPHAASAAQEIARATLESLDGAGVFAIEMFLTESGDVLVNEIAPRVHNSGHHTIEANATSQFEQHVRAVTGLPLGSTELRSPAAVMINILGQRDEALSFEGRDSILALADVHPHFYGKQPRPARKVGHITVLAASVDEAKELALKARKELVI